MSIHQITRNSISRTTQSEQPLRAGQIIQGRVLKLYPNNKAQIQLGSQVMVAQLEASLQLGERYLLQVENTTGLVQLKVIGDQSKAQVETSVGDLLRGLGLKATKNNITFTEKLIEERVPFDRQQLARAFKLVEGVDDQEAAEQIIKQMLREKTPLNEAVFKALYTKSTTELSTQLTALLMELKAETQPSALTQRVIQQLSTLLEQPATPINGLITQNITEAHENTPHLFHVLQVIGAVDSQIDFATFKNEWEAMISEQKIQHLGEAKQTGTQMITPLNMSEGDVIEALTHMQSTKHLIQSEAEVFINRWGKLINEAVISRTPLSNMSFSQLSQQIEARVYPLLTEYQQQTLSQQLTNNPAALRQLLTEMQALASESLYTTGEETLTHLTEQTNRATQPQTQFLNHLKHMLVFSGITDENLLARDLATKEPSPLRTWVNQINQSLMSEDGLSSEAFTQLKQAITERLVPLLTNQQANTLITLLEQNQPEQLGKLARELTLLMEQDAPVQELSLKDAQSLKSLLIQMVNESEGGRSERAQPLLHFINGLQLQSVHETNSFIQASLQLPGDALSLNQDLYLDFEGQKTADGKINADFCRIMFYLDLTHLRETIIDMNVQKRMIAVTIYNDREQMPDEFKLLQPLLKKGLAEHDYQLSRITLKPLSNVDKETFHQKQITRTPIDSASYEGIDFHI